MKNQWLYTWTDRGSDGFYLEKINPKGTRYFVEKFETQEEVIKKCKENNLEIKKIRDKKFEYLKNSFKSKD